MLRETFGRHFDDRSVRLIAAVGDSYDDLVRAWFRQVDASPGRLVSVRSTERDGVLRIAVDSDPGRQGRTRTPDRRSGPSPIGRPCASSSPTTESSSSTPTVGLNGGPPP